MLKRRFKIGTFFGIQLFVHWTFGLLIAFVAFQAREAGGVGILYGISTLLGAFTCVTLHEYGHALAARQFNVPTIDITLLPIGGVARLERMPRVPWQELVVAVAGPAVNVVIALLIATGLIVYGSLQLTGGITAARDFMNSASLALVEPSLLGFAAVMLLINVMLVVFNMIPAFPMDGGRVLRSLLAMVMEYRRATLIASRIGLVCAALMAVIAIQNQALIPGLVALFIGYAGIAEARQVDVSESVRGLTVRGAMLHHPPAVSVDTPWFELAGRWRAIPLAGIPVVSVADTVVGMVWLKDIAEWGERGRDPQAVAGELADHQVPLISLDETLESVIFEAGGKYRQLPVVDQSGRLVGLLDLDSVLSRGRLARSGGAQLRRDRLQPGDEQRLNMFS